LDFGDYDRFSLITSSVYMIITKFFFEKTYFVKTHLFMVHISSYGHYWLSYDRLTVSSVEFVNFDRFSLITSSIYMIITKFFFEKTYFVKTHLFMVHISSYGHYWLSYDRLTVSSVEFVNFDRFSLITSSIYMIIKKIFFHHTYIIIWHQLFPLLM
jgi:hypothetical protein